MSRPILTTPVFLAAVLGVGLLGWLLWWHAGILAPFVASVALAFVLRPLVDVAERRRCPRALGAGLVLLGLFLLIASLALLLVPIGQELLPQLRAKLPDLLLKLWGQVVPWLKQMGIDAPDNVAEIKGELSRQIESHGAQWSARLWSSLVVGGSSVLNTAGLLVLVPLLTFYWLLDWPTLAPKWMALVPRHWQAGWQDLMAECDTLLGQYLRGQLLVMAILAGFYGLGLSLGGFHLGWPIGVFTGLAMCIPYLGFGLGLVLALLAGLLQFADAPGGALHALGVVAVVYGIGQVIEGFYLTPRLVGERIGLHPLGVILALMLFGSWMGLWGVIIALPASALFMVLARRGWQRYVHSSFYGRD